MAKKKKKLKAKKTARSVNVIVAVAIGPAPRSENFLGASDVPKLANVRPYLKGLVDWLANPSDPPIVEDTPKPKTLGVDYIIKYRECEKKDLQATFNENADLIFCMSTTVLRAAQNFTNAAGTKTPIVGIISNPENEDSLNDNVCGVSARRPQHVRQAYKEFRKKVGKQKEMFVLHKKTYSPSEAGKFFLPRKLVTPIEIDETDTSDQIAEEIKAQLSTTAAGLLVLPVDQFFGAADKIMTAAKLVGDIPTWWLVPDMQTTSGIPFGAYGVPQATCGRFMAERVASIWDNNNAIPDPPFVEIDDKWNKLRPISKTIAKKKK